MARDAQIRSTMRTVAPEHQIAGPSCRQEGREVTHRGQRAQAHSNRARSGVLVSLLRKAGFMAKTGWAKEMTAAAGEEEQTEQETAAKRAKFAEQKEAPGLGQKGGRDM